MLLTSDIGNTNITLGVFDQDEFKGEYRIASDRDLSLAEYEVLVKSLLKDYEIDGCVIGSVVDELTDKFAAAVKNVYGIEPLIVSVGVNTDLCIKTDKPDEVGADRIANAIGAKAVYNKPIIVIDFGTATSFDVINFKGEFIGGVIAPGINLQMKSLNKFTSKLPRIDADISARAIGRNTSEAILSGVIRGTASMIDGLVKQCEEELGQRATLVATGGYSGLIANYLKRSFDYINPTLTLEGLKHIYNLNRSGKRSGSILDIV